MFRQTPFIVRAAAGVVYSRATAAATPSPIYRHQRVERVSIAGTGDVRVVMQAGVEFTVNAAVYSATKLDIAVAGGVWTQGDHVIDAVGLGSVRWTDYIQPTTVKVHAA